MQIKSKLILTIISSTFLFLISGNLLLTQANTHIIYSNNFDNLSQLEDWQPTPTSYWSLDNNHYKVEIHNKNTLATSNLKDQICHTWQNYSVSLLMRGDKGVDQHVDFYYQDPNNYYDLDLRWNGWVDSGNLYIARVVNGSKTFLTHLIPFNLKQHEWYSVRLENDTNHHFKVYLNNILALETTDDQHSFNGGCIRFRAWTGAAPEVSFEYDTLKVFKETTLEPVVVIPGLGASWNRDIFLGYTGGQWKMTPFVHVYDGLIQALEADGYQEDNNLFIWNYDWRRPVSEISSNFHTYIQNRVKPKIGNEKFSIVGHSLGGLVARTYQTNYNDSQVNKLITVGTPHKGASNAYLTWAGGKLWEKGSWANLALEIYLHLNQPKYGRRIDTIHALAPVVKDLLPTYPFLQKEDHSSITPKTTNDWLENLNHQPTPDNLLTLYGTTAQPLTLYQIILGPQPGFWDKINGLWPDGQLINKIYSPEGDGTVLSLSAAYASNPYHLDNQTHHGLVSSVEGTKAILTQLGLPWPQLSFQPQPSPHHSLIFLAHSPVKLQVRDSNNRVYGYQGNNNGVYYSPEDKLLIIPQADNSTTYTIQLIGTGSGHYILDVGKQLNDDRVVWDSAEGEINSNQTNSYQLDYQPNTESLKINSGLGEEDTLLSLVNQLTNSSFIRHNRRLRYYLRSTKRYLYLAKRYSNTPRRYSYLLRAHRFLILFEVTLNRYSKRLPSQDIFWTKHKLELINDLYLKINRQHRLYSNRYLSIAKRLESRNERRLTTLKNKLTSSSPSFKKYQLEQIDSQLSQLNSQQPDYIYYQIYFYYLLRSLN